MYKAVIMRIAVRFRGPIAGRMGTSEVSMDVEKDASLRELLRKLIESRKEVRAVWTTPEQLDQNTLLLRNEIDTELTGGLDTQLSNGDTVVILPLVHGGQT
jgi:molybdopterin converting factor small subunit